ncbi:MAG TPA: VOC family protein [Bacillaceae bacterium]
MIRWHHAGIQVKDLHASTDFYISLFGFQLAQRISLPGEEIVFLEKGEIRIELIKSLDDGPSGNTIHIAWMVENLDEWIDRLQENGLSTAEGPLRLENGWTSIFYTGLNGEWIELLQQTV